MKKIKLEKRKKTKNRWVLLKGRPNTVGSGCKPDPAPNTLEVMSTFSELIDKISGVATQHIWCSATQRSELNFELINKISGVTTQYIWRSASPIAQLDPRYVGLTVSQAL
jgi:hypothetical protein